MAAPPRSALSRSRHTRIINWENPGSASPGKDVRRAQPYAGAIRESECGRVATRAARCRWRSVPARARSARWSAPPRPMATSMPNEQQRLFCGSGTTRPRFRSEGLRIRSAVAAGGSRLDRERGGHSGAGRRGLSGLAHGDQSGCAGGTCLSGCACRAAEITRGACARQLDSSGSAERSARAGLRAGRRALHLERAHVRERARQRAVGGVHGVRPVA